ncbi:MAG: ArnT family glycosyltransferase [Caulobacteraceae bacterium]
MTFEERLAGWGRGWRGPVLAAVVALVAGLPGLIAIPPLDRDEARFAQASAQMLESGDFVTIHFQDTPRFKKPVGIYWLQAAAVAALSHVEDRHIWAWRVPSLLGAMLAAAACAWGAAAFLGPGGALMAGAMLGASTLLSTEAAIAATDAILCGATTLAMAALGRVHLAARGGPPAGWRSKLIFWLGLSLSILVKGPIGPMIVALTLLALGLWERRVAWLKDLGWGWGLLLVLAVVGPWALAITVATDGAFWGASIGGDLAPKLAGDQEGHGAPPGFHLALLPLLLFPASLLLPAGAVTAWRARAEPAVRFALCWLIPSWLVFEAAPTKLVHYPLPLYGALAWLMARALAEPAGRPSRWIGALMVALAGAALAVAGPLAMAGLHDWSGAAWGWAAAVLFLAAGGAAAVRLLSGSAPQAVALGIAGMLAAHGVFAACLVPALRPLWLSSRAAGALAAAGLSPRQGIAPGPVTVAGYEEPSLVFLLGTATELGDANDAAAAISEGRPAIVEGRLDGAFHAALARDGVTAQRVGEGAGLDYSNNRPDILRIYRPPPERASP